MAAGIHMLPGKANALPCEGALAPVMAPLFHSVDGIQVVLEGKLVNLDVTSPAATLALGLMFLRTNDAAIAAAFSLPDTHFALDYVRPDFVMLRILARSLVMQDGVQASQAWVEAQMPPLIKASVYMHFALCACGHACMHACVSMCMHACVHEYVHVHASVSVSVHA